MKSFLDWLHEDQFYIRGHYDPVTDEGGGVGPMIPLGVQQDILGHVFTPDEDGDFPYTTVIYSAPKKSGKTTVEAGVVCWWAEEYPIPTEIYMIANDEEQTRYRAFADVSFHFEKRNEEPDWPYTEVLNNEIRLDNGTRIFALAQEYKSAAGSRHSMTAWDELWAYTSERKLRMWAEMAPILIPGVPKRMRIVVTYAGFEEDDSPLRDIYDTVVVEGKNGTNNSGGPPAEPVPELDHIVDAKGNPVCWRKGSIFVYWDHEERMPWQQTEEHQEYLEETRNTKAPGDFIRHHKNMWVTGKEVFIPIAWWDRAEVLERPLVYDPQSPYRGHPLTIGVDVGYKQDASAAVAVWHDPGDNENPELTGLAHHKIWEPSQDLEIHMEEEIVSWILELAANVSHVRVVCDPANFYGGIIELKRNGIDVEEFNQNGAPMVYASSNLYQILKNEQFVAYDAPDMRSHLLHAVAENKGRGYRLKKKEGGDHVDAAIALAMACYDAKKNKGVDTSETIRFEAPFHDWLDEGYEERKRDEERAKEGIPMQLREHITREDQNKIWDELSKSEAEPFR